MNETTNMVNDEMEIDLGAIFKLLKKNLLMIIIVSFLFAGVGFTASTFFMKKKFSSNATIYITPKITEQGTIDYNSLQTNSRMVNNYMEILKGETILSKVAKQVGMENYKDVLESMDISNAQDTEIISITSTTTNPELSRDIVANTISIFTDEMIDILNLSNVTVINEPKVNDKAVSPSKSKFTVLGFLGGFIVSCGILCLQYVFDKRLRTREEVENFLGVPVLATVPLKK